MTTDLIRLLEAACKVTMSPDEKEAQRRSFAYGNARIGNDLMTREMIDRQAEALKIAREA